MKKTMFPALLAALCLTPQAQAVEYARIDTGKSLLGFVYTQMGVPMEGRLKNFDAVLAFDPAHPESAHAGLDMDITGIDAGSPEANDALAGKDWFDIKTHPRALFVSSGFKALGENRYEVSGYMTIKGRKRSISAPFVLKPQGDAAVLEGAFVLKRSDFAVGEGSWADYAVIANEVRLKFQFPVHAGSNK